MPDKPNSKIIDKPITNGGVMMGRMVKARKTLRYLNPDRVATKANTSPRAVVVAPTVIAKNNEFQAAPQPTVLYKQSSPQIFLSVNFSKNTPSEYTPSLSCKALIRICETGKKINAPTIATMKPMELTTKTSPLTAPRAAIPWVVKNKNAAETRMAP